MHAPRFSSFSRIGPLLAAITTAGFGALPLAAATINYGDFIGNNVFYANVSETAASPGDTEPLFGVPNIHGDALDFDPLGFAASALSAGSDLTDAQLSFTLTTTSTFNHLTNIFIREGGDHALAGSGTPSTQVGFGVSLGSVSVLAVDGQTLPTPVSLSGASASGAANLGAGPELLSPWSIALSYDIEAALTNAGVPFQFGASSLEITLDNLLTAISEDSTIAHITKKDFFLEAEIESNRTGQAPLGVPEPGSLSLLALACAALLRNRHRPPHPPEHSS